MFFIYSNCHSESKHVSFVIVEFDFNETDKIEKMRFKNYLNSLILLVEDDSKIIGDHSLEGMKVLSVLKDYWY